MFPEKLFGVSWKSGGNGKPKTIRNFTADSIKWNNFTDTFSLTQIDKKALADILFNYKYRIKGKYELGSSCYIPRDAILFLDKNGNLLDYVEICFECTDYRLKTDKWKFDFCEGKLGLLAKFKAILFGK